ncbi:Zinc-finger domain-containing protein [Pandoravirus kuranda]|uniref:Zinc-finger domain-containing protein n=1 Tax=Pandoravirus kuranda TaxID=3019033 RepID=A0AA95J6J0_9VIRU|nr:Zinc-finger domain-containing protein [Pandoravirus kuranda]
MTMAMMAATTEDATMVVQEGARADEADWRSWDASASTTPLCKVFAYECRVEPGSPDRSIAQAPALGVSAPRTFFDGECYLCGGEGHSQNYCPLSRCHTCHRYGHSERACCFAARPHGLYTARSLPSASCQRRARDRRAMFGSRWRTATSTAAVDNGAWR